MASDFSTAEVLNRRICRVEPQLAGFSRMLCLALKIGDFQ
jgi:hypothetical protein